jgi:hypothetical protein
VSLPTRKLRTDESTYRGGDSSSRSIDLHLVSSTRIRCRRRSSESEVIMDNLKKKIEQLPRRREYLGGQEISYVQLDSVLALLEEKSEPKHNWQFYMNGSFCTKCNAQLGSESPCIS